MQLLALLRDLLFEQGASEAEVAAYRILLTQDGATPAEIAKRIHQSRGRTYELLRDLVDRGLAVEEASRPIRFRAVPLADVVTTRISDLHSQVRLLEQVKSQVPASPPVELAERQVRPGDVTVWIGRSTVFAEIRRMAMRAKSHFLLGGPGLFPARLLRLPRLLEEVRSAQSRGVDLRLFMQWPSASATHYASLVERFGPGSVVKLSPVFTSTLGMAANEDAALFIFIHPDDESVTRGDDFAIRIESPLAVDVATRRLRGGDSATRTSSVVEPLDPPTVVRRLQEALDAAKQTVHAFGTRHWPHFAAAPLYPHFGNALERGVAFRAVAASDAPPGGPEAAQVWQVRTVDAVPMDLIIVDESEMFQAFFGPGGPSELRLRYSNDPIEVSHFLNMFEQLWSQAASPPRDAVEDAAASTRRR